MSSWVCRGLNSTTHRFDWRGKTVSFVDQHNHRHVLRKAATGPAVWQLTGGPNRRRSRLVVSRKDSTSSPPRSLEEQHSPWAAGVRVPCVARIRREPRSRMRRARRRPRRPRRRPRSNRRGLVVVSHEAYSRGHRVNSAQLSAAIQSPDRDSSPMPWVKPAGCCPSSRARSLPGCIP